MAVTLEDLKRLVNQIEWAQEKLSGLLNNCKHWREYDDAVGTFEYCKAKNKKCSCCGVRTQCNYPAYFNATEEQIKKNKARDSINRTLAMIGVNQNVGNN